jgi:dTDP-4-amino-4,6-dideoxygalactose transaminase
VAEYCACDHAVGVGSGTDALYLSLAALNLGPGDEVITTPFTFIATVDAIYRVGAKPVFVDAAYDTFNLDPTRLEEAITDQTKVILPVHLFGQPCDMDALARPVGTQGLSVVEDCAQAIGARLADKPVGSFGAAGCLSFFPTKNLGGFGDGGMVITNNHAIAERVGMLRRHGTRTPYKHEEIGVNSRLDELQAALLLVKMARIEEVTDRRRQIAQRYDTLLCELPGISVPTETTGSRCVYHQYTLKVTDRDRVRSSMQEAGIATSIYYPIPLHLQPVCEELGYTRGMFPVSEELARTCLSLPMHLGLTDEDQDRVAEALSTAVAA